jgi:hypothetical protein
MFRQVLLKGFWLVSAVGAPGCANEYPIPPTFCDDFCRATLRPGCDTEPENCVRECQLQPIGAACEAHQQALLRCYQSADDDAFECSGFGGTRVKGGVCETARDALLICELPQMEPCLEVCRPYQATLDERVLSPVDAGVTERCPLLHQSCEGICWNLLSIGTLDPEDLRETMVPQAVPLGDASAADLLISVTPLLEGCGL